MSRRTLEAVLKFGYGRLLKQKPVNKKGHGLMLNGMFQAFRGQKPPLIPEHLLHVADSIRVIGTYLGPKQLTSQIITSLAVMPNLRCTRQFTDVPFA